MSSPGQLIAKYLADAGKATIVASPLGAWPVYVGSRPDGAGVPDEVVSIFDTEGNGDGRLMNGPTINHPGIQIVVRSPVYDTAYDKIKDIATTLDAILRTPVVVGGHGYTLQAFKQFPILFWGFEQGNRQRALFSLNGTLTFS